jgi:bifunctional non-homologous end joining protein LigD
LGDDWIHEVKFDGYRAQAHKGDGRITIFSRKGYSWRISSARSPS